MFNRLSRDSFGELLVLRDLVGKMAGITIQASALLPPRVLPCRALGMDAAASRKCFAPRFLSAAPFRVMPVARCLIDTMFTAGGAASRQL